MTIMQRFGRDESGNFAVITALTLSVLLTSVGIAVDMAGATSHKQKLQAQVDAAILAAAAGAAATERDGDQAVDQDANNQGQIKTRVREFVQEDPRFNDAGVRVTVTGSEISVVAESEYKTMIMGMFGKPSMTTSATATVPRATTPPMDIALVLDTTFSMDGSNMDALRSASLELLDNLEASNETVRVSLVPYGDYVNIGTGRAGETWLQATKPDEFTPARSEERNIWETVTPRTCVGTGEMIDGERYDDGILVDRYSYERQNCTGGDRNVIGTEMVDIPAKAVTYEWRGCAGSRPAPANARPDASASDKIIGALHPTGDPGKVRCGVEMIPLTDNFDDLRDGVTALTPSGKTYLASGLAWGWRALDPREPFTEAASNPNAMKAIIFMTDGGNVRSQNQEYHNGNNALDGNAHAMTLCDGIKDAGITLYTVAYDIPMDNNLAVDPVQFMADCASSSGQAYSADNVFELKSSFKSILRSMMDVRLTR